MKAKFLAAAGAVLIAAVPLAGCSGSNDTASSVGVDSAVQSTVESQVQESQVSSDPEAWMEKNTNLEINRTALTQGNVVINYPVLDKMDTASKQEALNAILLEDATSCLQNNFSGAATDVMGTMDFTIVYQTRQYLSVGCKGSFTRDGIEEPQTVYYVTNLDLQSGERAVTPVRANAAALAKTLVSGQNYTVLMAADDMMAQQKSYLTGMKEADLAALLTQCDYTDADRQPKCFSYYLDKDNVAIYIPVSHALKDYVTVRVPVTA